MKQDPMNEWVLREELLAAFHRSPGIVLFALAGTLFGLAFAYLWPTAYQASVGLSVELNPYRVLDDESIPEFTGAEFRNIDDYKHWQMLQLSIVVSSDPYIVETLSRLREVNPDWTSVSEEDLREMLNPNWRNAGVWHLVGNTSTAAQAAEAVETWRDVVIDLTRDSITSSRELFRLELTLRSLNNELVEAQLGQAELESMLVVLEDTRVELISMAGDEVFSKSVRRELLSIANQLSDLIPGEQILLNGFPPEDATVNEYIDWLEIVIMLLEAEIGSIEMKIAVLQDEISEVSAEWEKELVNASGLSATLNLENRQSTNARVEELRSYSLAALIGALVGLLAWIMVFLVRVTRQGYR